MSEAGFLLAGLIAVAVLLIAIYVLGWRATSGRSFLTRLLVRAGLPVLVLVPLVFVLVPQYQHYDPDRAAKSAAEEKEKVARERPRRYEYRHEAPVGGARSARNGQPGPTAGDPSPPAAANGETGIAAAPPPPAMPEGTEAAGRGLAAPRAREAMPEASDDTAAPADRVAEAAAPDDGWDVVPVFYGTDRRRADNAARLEYAAYRGRQLELGRALVTVPKSHQVPMVERPWALRIPYFDVTIYEEDEDPNKHFTLKELKSLSRADFLALVRTRLAASVSYKDQAFVFVHGFNSTFENSVYRTAQIAYDLKFDGAPFLYSWPSGGGFSSYTYDRESSGQSTPYMRDFLQMVLKETGAKAVSVIAHSMGNQPVLQVLRDLKYATPDGVIISQVILAAPDVDRDAFENIAREIKGLAKGVTLYVAANDQALEISRRFNGGVPRAGDVPAGGPLVLPGIDTIDVTAASTDSLGLNHSGYAENNALLDDIARLIQTGERPPEKRIPTLERITTDNGEYWRYPLGN